MCVRVHGTYFEAPYHARILGFWGPQTCTIAFSAPPRQPQRDLPVYMHIHLARTTLCAKRNVIDNNHGIDYGT